MTKLMEWKSAGREDVLPDAPYTKLLLISSSSSEIEFLHGFEACSHLLCRAAGIQQYYRGKELLSLWIKIGRPHPVILRRALLGIEPHPNLADRASLTDLVNWSWASFNAVREFARSQSTNDNASVAERDANKEALEQVEKATGSEPVKGEDLLESEEAKRQLREAKERLKSESP